MSGESKQTILILFGNVVLITLSVIFKNICEWKNMWKYV